VRKCSEVECREGHGEMWVHQFMTLSIPLLLVCSVPFIVCSVSFIVCSVSFIVCVVLCAVFV
jgi:hypothetical protein